MHLSDALSERLWGVPAVVWVLVGGLALYFFAHHASGAPQSGPGFGTPAGPGNVVQPNPQADAIDQQRAAVTAAAANGTGLVVPPAPPQVSGGDSFNLAGFQGVGPTQYAIGRGTA